MPEGFEQDLGTLIFLEQADITTMRITFERSGGFTGIGVSTVIDTDQLDADVAREIAELVEMSGFFELQEDSLAGGAGADRFQYTVKIDDEGRSRTLRIGDESNSPELDRLLRRLTIISRAREQSR